MNKIKISRHRKVSRGSVGIKRKLLCYTSLIVLAAGWGSSLANEIFVSGNPGALIINTAIAGFDLDPVIDSSTTYSIDIFDPNMKITGQLNTAMPAYTTLKVTLEAPAGATSQGQVTLTTTGQDLVTGLDENMVESGLSITYEFSATVDAGVVSSGSKTVTFTVTDSS